MRNVVIIILGLALALAGCGGGGGTSATTNASTGGNTGAVLPTKDQSSEAWFVDSDGRVFGVTYSTAGTPTMCVWLRGQNDPKPLSIPAEASSYIIKRMTIDGGRQHMNNLDQIGYAGANSAAIVNLLTGATVPLADSSNTTGAVPTDINDAGVCVGGCKTPRWDGFLLDTPALWSAAGEPGGKALPSDCACGVVNGINNSGYAIGTAWSDGCAGPAPRAVIWGPDYYIIRQIQPYQDIYGSQINSEGILISDSGYAVIHRSYTFELVSPTGTLTAFGTTRDNTVVSAINAQGQVAGSEFDGPKVWNPDGSIIRLPLPFACARCTVHDISDRGVVVGTAAYPDSDRRVAAVWKLNP